MKLMKRHSILLVPAAIASLALAGCTGTSTADTKADATNEPTTAVTTHTTTSPKPTTKPTTSPTKSDKSTGRPTAKQVAPGLKTILASQVPNMTDAQATCIAQKLVDSKVSDATLRNLADGKDIQESQEDKDIIVNGDYKSCVN